MKQYDIALTGKDLRVAYMASYLQKKGYRIICYDVQYIIDKPEYTASDFSNSLSEQQEKIVYAGSVKEAVEKARVVIGGIPFTESDKIAPLLSKGQSLFGGVLSGDFVADCSERGISCYDFMKDETITVFNAIATAEGSILEALSHQPTNIHGSNSLVLGYGRCGSVLAEKLKGLSAHVTVCARSKVQLAQAQAYGTDTLLLDDLEKNISEYEYIYNTIPACILSESLLKKLHPDALVIDIASKPGGVDYAAAKELGIAAYLCPGLPGKYAPKISASKLTEYVIQHITDR